MAYSYVFLAEEVESVEEEIKTLNFIIESIEKRKKELLQGENLKAPAAA